MAVFETWLKSDLKKPLNVLNLSGNLFSSDNGGNLIGVEVLDNGSPTTLTGGVMGYIIREDGETVTVSGTLSGNKASIVLPASAYVVVGHVSIVIKVGTTTVGACTGYVYRTTTDTLVDPGHIIPSLEELLAKIADMEAGTTAANAAASNANAKATLADQKATLANTAASNADAKATAANTAAGNANTAASAANTAASKIDNMTVAASGLPAGSVPTAAISEVSGHKHIVFGLPKGDKGDKGDQGKDFHISHTFISVDAMEEYTEEHPGEVDIYNYAMIDTGSVEDVETGRLYCYESDEQWHYIGDLSGKQGIKGETGNGISSVVLNNDYTLTITFTDGTSYTTTSIRGAIGATGNGIASITLNNDYTLTIAYTDGTSTTTGAIRGATGATPDFQIGTVTTGAAGSSASATITGTTEEPVLNLTIPKGDPGDATIDDDAGAGDTDKVWSADKTYEEAEGLKTGKADIIEISDSTEEAVKTIPDGADGEPMALTVGIEPVQDLNGYDNPWPGGGGKNLLENQASSLTKNGITCTVNSDGTMELNGTCTSATAFIIGTVEFESTKEYIMSGCPTGGAMDTYHLWIYKSGTSENYMDTGNGVTINPQSDGQYEVEITALLGASFDQAIFKPMVRLSSVTDDTYAPYSNICPISGWTGCNVTRTGKNLFDKTATTAGVYINEDGTIGESSSWCISDYMPVVAGGQISYKGLTNRGTNPRAAFYDENKAFISSFRPSLADYYTMDVPAGVRFVRFSIADAQSHYDKNTFMMVEGNDIGDYEAYNSTTLQISFPSSAGTVYGGTLTVNKDGTGTLVVDQKKVILDGSEDWRSTTNAFYAGITGDYLKESTAKGACDSYDFIGGISGAAGMAKNSTIGMFTGSSYHRIYIRDDQYGVDTAAFKSALATNNVTLCYELATPVLYNLTELEVIETLKGINNIFADTGDILSVDYSADTKMYVDAEDESKQEQIDSIHSMIADSDTVTATESHAIGDVFICNNALLRATDAIATGETIVIGSNAEVINLADYIKEQVTDIAVLRTDVDALKALPISMDDILLKKLGFSDFVSESSNYGRVELHGNVLTAKATPSGSTYYHINLLGTHRVKSGTWENYNPLPEDFMPIDDYFKSTYMTDKNRKYCLRTVGEVNSGSGSLRLIVMKDNGDSTYTYKYATLTTTFANIALLDEAPLDISKWDGISLVFTTQSRPADMKVIFSVEEGDGGTYTLENK